MNWEALGAIGDFVGAVAVVATLVYLAIRLGKTHEQCRRKLATR